MKIIHTKHFPFGRYSTINLFGVLFTKRDNLSKDGQHKTYRDVSFEEEAYNNEKNLDYLKARKYYSWWKYIKPNSNEIH